ncbi:MAG: transglycosylase SLT domain-containing protein, partial [Acidobacteriota bacterium]
MTIAIDPTSEVIAKAEREFTAGQIELTAGRLVAARDHFDASIDQLLALPGGARGNARISAAYDELLDRISALDLLALREGDGFTEIRSEPAAIDELLGVAMFERPQPAATTEETVKADLVRTPHDIDIPVNDKVLSYVELFQGRMHDFTQAALDRSVRYMPMIREVFKAENLPLDLAYVPIVESAFKTNALSHASARGMWQFMAATGQEHGLQQNWFVDERSDPEKATRAAATYLKTLRDYFDGDWNLALAAYNAGPGRIGGVIKKVGTTDYWKLAKSSVMPRDTREYVPMIMASILIARNPTLYGFEAGTASPLAYELVTVPNALDLKIIAEWISVSVDDLRELNPELRRTTTPKAAHELKVPVGTAATIQTQLVTADSLFAKFGNTFHTVKRGETIATIARSYKVSQSELRQANELTVKSKLRANQELMIPQRTTNSLPSASAVRTARAAATARPVATLTYRVQRGD